MSSIAGPAPSAAPYLNAGAWALGAIVLTGVHHAYGALVFDTPYRLHILQIGAPIGVLIAGALAVAWWRWGTMIGRAALWIAAGAIIFFPILLIGIYEGGFNHLSKNVAYLFWGIDGLAALNAAGDNPLIHGIIHFALGGEARAELTGSDALEPPVDIFFEVTGIAQFFIALPVAWATARLWRATR